MIYNIYKPDASIRTLTINDLDASIQCSDLAMLDDVDDEMSLLDINQASISSNSAIYRELPQNNFNIRTLTQEMLEEMKRDSNLNIIWSS